MKTKLISFLIACCVLCGMTTPYAFAADASLEVNSVEQTYQHVAAFHEANMPEGGYGFGDEWTVFGLARGNALSEEAKQQYLSNLSRYVQENSGILTNVNNTDYARVILALSSLGADPRDFAGYDLTAPFADFETTTSQIFNGPAFALIALDSGAYEIPALAPEVAATQATREAYVENLLSYEVEGGGFALLGEEAGVDYTSIALQALAPYRSAEYPGVEEAVERGTGFLSQSQSADGGFATDRGASSESCMQVIIALNALDIGLEDERFVKEGNTVYDALMTYYNSEAGTFSHEAEGGADTIASYQGLYTLNSLYRSLSGENGLYNMTDITPVLYDYEKAEPKEGAATGERTANVSTDNVQGGGEGKQEEGGIPPVTFVGGVVALFAVAAIVGVVARSRRKKR